MKKIKLKRKYRVKLNILILMSLFIIATTFIIDKTPFSFVEIGYDMKEKTAYAESDVESKVSNKQKVVEESIEPEIIPEPFTDYFLFIEEISMPYEHQEYLYNRSIELNVDYAILLAVIATESNFDSKVISSTNDYGYFQVNTVNHKRLADLLDTSNQPLNAYINIMWGTYMLADLYEHWSKKGLVGDKLNHHVWSSYNKGLTGFKKYGPATQYISKIEKNAEKMNVILDKAVRAELQKNIKVELQK